MHWTLRGAHLLLQTRTKVLNNELEETFRRWYPLFRPQALREPPRVAAALLDHVIVWSEGGLSRHLRRFADYYHRSRTHLGLQKDTPESRPVQGPGAGRIVAIPEVGGLHHRYERRAA